MTIPDKIHLVLVARQAPQNWIVVTILKRNNWVGPRGYFAEFNSESSFCDFNTSDLDCV